jgi:pyruvate dehydrogenase E2 component (dihydrolipoamide acetyltransferase)
MGEFRMPLLGADMVAGTLTEWYKQPGEPVHRGDIIAAVDTDKGSIDVEVFEDGVVERLLVEPGRKVPVGTVLAVIKGAEGASAPPPPPPPPTPAPEVLPPQVGAPRPLQPPMEGERLRVSPVARRIATALGVDLTSVRGSGAGGAILREDVEAAARAAAAPAPSVPTTPPSPGEAQARMRRAIGAAMARSKREIPHFYLATTLDFGPASEWLTRRNATVEPAERLLPAVLLLKATALALLEFPELNARFEGERVIPAQAIHIGVATSLRGGGLVVPAIHHVNRKTLPDLMRELRDVVQRARAGSLRSSDLADGTVTVTSLGDRSADLVLGVIYPPQTALVGYGTVVTRPWVVEGQVMPRPLVGASLSADHRASDGHRGGAFLATVGRLLERPEGL